MYSVGDLVSMDWYGNIIRGTIKKITREGSYDNIEVYYKILVGCNHAYSTLANPILRPYDYDWSEPKNKWNLGDKASFMRQNEVIRGTIIEKQMDFTGVFLKPELTYKIQTKFYGFMWVNESHLRPYDYDWAKDEADNLQSVGLNGRVKTIGKNMFANEPFVNFNETIWGDREKYLKEVKSRLDKYPFEKMTITTNPKGKNPFDRKELEPTYKGMFPTKPLENTVYDVVNNTKLFYQNMAKKTPYDTTTHYVPDDLPYGNYDGKGNRVNPNKDWIEKQLYRPELEPTPLGKMSDKEIVDMITETFKEYSSKSNYDIREPKKEELKETRKNYMMFYGFPFVNCLNDKKPIKPLPTEVHFNAKSGKTTLCFGDKPYTTYSTQVNGTDKFDKLYGFLMAYFRWVYRDKGREWRIIFLEKYVYSQNHKAQKNILEIIFIQNSGLKLEKTWEYLGNVLKEQEPKTIEFMDKEKGE